MDSSVEKEYALKPIGVFRSPYKNFLEAPRQATHDVPDSWLELNPGHQYEQALSDLSGFERIWVIFSFHLKTEWKPMVQPPRGSDKKRGVFSTRSPLRPNHLGLSCLKLERIEGLKVFVSGSDLLDETPIFDIKPYLPYADSFPNSKIGWLEGADKDKWKIQWDVATLEPKNWLSQNRLYIEPIVKNQLEFDPTNSERKRVYPIDEVHWVFAYRTWRILFEINPEEKLVKCLKIFSGYSTEDLNKSEDPYNDKGLHHEFMRLFS
jgi:tRNA-Thr(GGU) m(6)t(6)A37 methyltransferase TsaA